MAKSRTKAARRNKRPQQPADVVELLRAIHRELEDLNAGVAAILEGDATAGIVRRLDAIEKSIGAIRP